jgi:hypothetical protein
MTIIVSCPPMHHRFNGSESTSGQKATPKTQPALQMGSPNFSPRRLGAVENE